MSEEHSRLLKVSRSEEPKSAQNNTQAGTSEVLQVERRDFTELVPTDRTRVQSMRGFDDCYTDIVDYIVRCTHKIWDERDVGLIYTHYTHNCVLYGVLGTMYDRESVVRETVQRIVEFPDRRGMAIGVIWRGDDVNGFYTSHMDAWNRTPYGVWVSGQAHRTQLCHADAGRLHDPQQQDLPGVGRSRQHGVFFGSFASTRTSMR